MPEILEAVSNVMKTFIDDEPNHRSIQSEFLIVGCISHY
jgi:hypothetical protein